MGITGLLPLMKGAISNVKLSTLSGTVAAVDTNGWIHRACYSCGDKVYLNEETDMYINYCVGLCDVLRKHGITPILVFDGQSLPAKAETKAKRTKRKLEVRQKIEEMIAAGDTRGARWLMRQCVDVTFEMIHRVIVRLRVEKIDYLVAPYEADAQIVYLVNSGIADYAITEDSDLLVFGCKRTLYKLDKENEKGEMLTLDRLDKCFKNFCEIKFQYMCILSGCDYLANIPNVGIGRARKFFESLTATPSIECVRDVLRTIPAVLNMRGKVTITDDYLERFIRAVYTFDHQLVFSPRDNTLTHLKPLRGGIERHRELRFAEFAGDFFPANCEPDFAAHYARGNVHPKTLRLIDEQFSPFVVDDDDGDNNNGQLSCFTKIVRQRVCDDKVRFMNCESPKKVFTTIVPESPPPPPPASSNKKKPKKGMATTENGAGKQQKAKNAKIATEKKRKIAPISPPKVERKRTTADDTKRLKLTSSSKKDDTSSIVSDRARRSFALDVVDEVKREPPSSRTSSRNIFRRGAQVVIEAEKKTAKTEIESKTTTTTTSTSTSSSRYFNKNSKISSITTINGHRSPIKTAPTEPITKSSSPLPAVKSWNRGQRSSSSSTANPPKSTKSEMESDFDESEFDDIIVAENRRPQADLDRSVSDIDDDEKRILANLNGTQSSGYGSQRTNDSQQTLRSPSPWNNAKFSPPPQNGKPRANTALKRKSPKIARSSKSIAESPKANTDIRNFFSKRST